MFPSNYEFKLNRILVIDTRVHCMIGEPLPYSEYIKNVWFWILRVISMQQEATRYLNYFCQSKKLRKWRLERSLEPSVQKYYENLTKSILLWILWLRMTQRIKFNAASLEIKHMSTRTFWWLEAGTVLKTPFSKWTTAWI